MTSIESRLANPLSLYVDNKNRKMKGTYQMNKGKFLPQSFLLPLIPRGSQAKRFVSREVFVRPTK